MRIGTTVLGVATAITALAYGYGERAQAQQEQPRLAYINSAQIIDQTPGIEDVRQTLDREMARWRSEVQALSDSLQRMISEYEQQQVMLTPDKRQERQQELAEKQREYSERAQGMQQRAQRRQQELLQPLYDKVYNTLEDIRREKQYDLVFDVTAGGLVAADTALDITDDVIARLQAQSAP